MSIKHLLSRMLFCGILMSGTFLCNSQINEKYPDFESRGKMMIDSLAEWAGEFTLEEFKGSDDFDGGKYGAYPIMALFERGNTEKAREFTEQQMNGGAAMFREFSTMALYMQYNHLYGEELCEKVKQNQLKSNFFIVDAKNDPKDQEESHRNARLGGASENHKLMYAAAAYLAGIAWPEDYPKEWYQIGYDHLMNWFDIVTSIGFWEEDSPTYLIHHMGPLVTVADFAPEGSEMKKRATMVLDWYFASIAGEYLHGYWITPTARDYNPLYGMAVSAETTSLTWLMFGDASQIPYPHVYKHFYHWKASLHFAVSEYRVPDILKRIATDRDEAFIHKEYMAKNPMQPKEYCFIDKQYGMASIMEENSKNIPPDMTRWKVQWVTDNPEKEPSVFLMKHPYSSDWETFRGASPAEQLIQYEGTLIAVYKIEDGEKQVIEAPFRRESYEEVITQDDWMFLHTGSCLLAVKAIKGLELSDEKRSTDNHGPIFELQVLRSSGKRNGLIVQTASLDKYNAKKPGKSLSLFMKDVLKNTEVNAKGIDMDDPELSYRDLSGNILKIKFNEYKSVNGNELNFDNWPLLGNPWMYQEYKGRKLVLQHANEKIIYDFESWEVKKE